VCGACGVNAPPRGCPKRALAGAGASRDAPIVLSDDDDDDDEVLIVS
jgi:hypothetical protein